MNHERSSCSLTAPISTGAQKLGHPVPESNLVVEENSGAPQHTQLNMPARFARLRGLVNAGSVPCWRVTRYCSGVSVVSHARAGLMTFVVRSAAGSGPLGGLERARSCPLH